VSVVANMNDWSPHEEPIEDADVREILDETKPGEIDESMSLVWIVQATKTKLTEG